MIHNMQRLKSLALIGMLVAAMVTPLCGYWFSCGCAWPWDGFFMTCNVFFPTAPGPHCPWCTHPLSAVTTLSGSILLGELVQWRISGTSAKLTLGGSLLGIIAALLVLALGGWLTALFTQHPFFLGFPMA